MPRTAETVENNLGSMREMLEKITAAMRSQNTHMNDVLTNINEGYRSLRTVSDEQSESIYALHDPVKAISTDLKFFTGEEGSEYSFDDFSELFEIIAKAHGWGAAKRLNMLPAYLRRGALLTYNNLAAEDKTSYERLKLCLKYRLLPVESSRFAMLKLQKRAQREFEPVSQFAYDLQKLVQTAYKHLGEQPVAEMLLYNFIDKLRPDLRKYICMFEPKTFEDALTRAKKLEANNLLSGGTAEVTRQVNHISSSLDESRRAACDWESNLVERLAEKLKIPYQNRENFRGREDFNHGTSNWEGQYSGEYYTGDYSSGEQCNVNDSGYSAQGVG